MESTLQEWILVQDSSVVHIITRQQRWSLASNVLGPNGILFNAQLMMVTCAAKYQSGIAYHPPYISFGCEPQYCYPQEMNLGSWAQKRLAWWVGPFLTLFLMSLGFIICIHCFLFTGIINTVLVPTNILREFIHNFNSTLKNFKNGQRHAHRHQKIMKKTNLTWSTHHT